MNGVLCELDHEVLGAEENERTTPGRVDAKQTLGNGLRQRARARRMEEGEGEGKDVLGSERRATLYIVVVSLRASVPITSLGTYDWLIIVNESSVVWIAVPTASMSRISRPPSPGQSRSKMMRSSNVIECAILVACPLHIRSHGKSRPTCRARSPAGGRRCEDHNKFPL